MNVAEAIKEDQLIRENAAKRTFTNRPKFNYFKLEVNKGAKIRFLSEFNTGVSLWRHKLNEMPWYASCLRNDEYGSREDCPYCLSADPQSKRPKRYHFWQIYNYATERVELLCFKNTSFTPFESLRVLNDEEGSLMERDFTIRRVPAPSPTGKGTASTYVAVPNGPSVFPITGLEVPSRESIIEAQRPFEK
jgi:hypothetical protein